MSSINEFSPFKSPGHDNIYPIVLQKLSSVNRDYIKSIFNPCIINFYYPIMWRLALLKILMKSGKRESDNYKSYRPISLLPILGKWFGKILFERLNWHTHQEQWLSNKQFSFQAGRFCDDALA